ncbi:MAG: tetratricopeptide repeat protein, partial [Candidatus Omnitrophota bacterium]
LASVPSTNLRSTSARGGTSSPLAAETPAVVARASSPAKEKESQADALFDAAWDCEDDLNAVELWKQYLVVRPNDPYGWQELGWHYDELGRYDEAIAAYENALKRNPEDALAWNNLGVAFGYGKRDYPAALKAYQRAHQLAPQNRIYRKNVKNLLKESELSKDEIAAAEREVDARVAEVEAAIDARLAMEADPNISYLRMNTAALKAQLEWLREALQYFGDVKKKKEEKEEEEEEEMVREAISALEAESAKWASDNLAEALHRAVSKEDARLSLRIEIKRIKKALPKLETKLAKSESILPQDNLDAQLLRFAALKNFAQQLKSYLKFNRRQPGEEEKAAMLAIAVKEELRSLVDTLTRSEEGLREKLDITSEKFSAEKVIAEIGKYIEAVLSTEDFKDMEGFEDAELIKENVKAQIEKEISQGIVNYARRYFEQEKVKVVDVADTLETLLNELLKAMAAKEETADKAEEIRNELDRLNSAKREEWNKEEFAYFLQNRFLPGVIKLINTASECVSEENRLRAEKTLKTAGLLEGLYAKFAPALKRAARRAEALSDKFEETFPAPALAIDRKIDFAGAVLGFGAVAVIGILGLAAGVAHAAPVGVDYGFGAELYFGSAQTAQEALAMNTLDYATVAEENISTAVIADQQAPPPVAIDTTKNKGPPAEVLLASADRNWTPDLPPAETPQQNTVQTIQAKDFTGNLQTFTVGDTMYYVAQSDGHIQRHKIESINMSHGQMALFYYAWGAINEVLPEFVYANRRDAEAAAGKEIKLFKTTPQQQPPAATTELQAQDATGKPQIFSPNQIVYYLTRDKNIDSLAITKIENGDIYIQYGTINRNKVYVNRSDAEAAEKQTAQQLQSAQQIKPPQVQTAVTAAKPSATVIRQNYSNLGAAQQDIITWAEKSNIQGRAPPFSLGFSASPGPDITIPKYLVWNQKFVDMLSRQIAEMKAKSGLPEIAVFTYYPVVNGTDLERAKQWMRQLHQAGAKLYMNIPNVDDRFIPSYYVNYWNDGKYSYPGNFREVVAAFKDEPGFGGWVVFNEYNRTAADHPDWYGAKTKEQAILNILDATRYVALEIKKIDPSRPVYTVWGGFPEKDEVERVGDAVDGWLLNYYELYNIVNGMFFKRGIEVFGGKIFGIHETSIDSRDPWLPGENQALQAREAQLIYLAARYWVEALNLSNFKFLSYMSSNDEPWKRESPQTGLWRTNGMLDFFDEQFWGFWKADGTAKQVVEVLSAAIREGRYQPLQVVENPIPEPKFLLHPENHTNAQNGIIKKGINSIAIGDLNPWYEAQAKIDSLVFSTQDAAEKIEAARKANQKFDLLNPQKIQARYDSLLKAAAKEGVRAKVAVGTRLDLLLLHHINEIDSTNDALASELGRIFAAVGINFAPSGTVGSKELAKLTIDDVDLPVLFSVGIAGSFHQETETFNLLNKALRTKFDLNLPTWAVLVNAGLKSWSGFQERRLNVDAGGVWFPNWGITSWVLDHPEFMNSPDINKDTTQLDTRPWVNGGKQGTFYNLTPVDLFLNLQAELLNQIPVIGKKWFRDAKNTAWDKLWEHYVKDKNYLAVIVFGWRELLIYSQLLRSQDPNIRYFVERPAKDDPNTPEDDVEYVDYYKYDSRHPEDKLWLSRALRFPKVTIKVEGKDTVVVATEKTAK